MIHKSIQISRIFFLLVLLIPSSLNAQEAPGGIGNATGSDGQPELKLWLLPDSLGLSEGDDVTSWTDYSGNGNDLDGSDVSPKFREDAFNGHDYVDFAANLSRVIKSSFAMPTEAVSVFYVLKAQEDPNQSLCPLSYEEGANEYLILEHPDDGDFGTFVKDNNHNPQFDFADNQWKILSHQWRSSDGRLLVHANSTETVNTSHQSGTSLTSGGTLALGAEQDGEDSGYNSDQDFEGGAIAEFIMFGSSLKQAQRVVIENYLAQKYGQDAKLATDHYQPGDASYIVSMTGMGKESDGVIEANAEGIHLSQNGGLNNGEYLMTAHDGASNTEADINTSTEVTSAGVDSAWNRSWYLHKTGSFDAKVAFDFGEGIDGKNPGELQYYELLYRANLTDNYSTVTVAGRGVQNGDQIYFDVNDANLQDGYYTLGSSDANKSPLTGVKGQTWYTLVSGDWGHWETWTLDPSGALPDNPNHETPTASDDVVILTGKTVTVNQDDVVASELTVEGRLDFQDHTGQSFGTIKGSGRILLRADNFPTGADASHFYSKGQGEGTVVYYGTSYNLNQSLEVYDLEINLNNATDKLTLLSNYTINGNLTINQGQLQINDNSTTTDLTISVQDDLTIASGGSLLTGSADARHQLNLYGDFTNNGTAEFTNRTSPDYNSEAGDGIVDVNFLSDNTNQRLYCNGTTNFYRIEIDKGSDATYQLVMEATDPAYFNLYGPADYDHGETAQLTTNDNALGLLRGTVRLKNNVDMPVLNNGGNYNVSEAAQLWIDGGSATKNSGTALVDYGVIRVSDGTLNATVSSGITTRDDGLVKVTGGTLNMNQLRTSTLGASNIGGYVQSGGKTNVLGGNTNTDYYAFSLTYPGNVFNMSGGTLHIHEAHGKGGIFIASDEVNQNVTGGTVIAEISDGENFPITSKAPFWNLIIRNSNSGTGKHVLTNGTDVGSTDENLDVQDLHVLNDLTIETGTTRSDGTNTYGSYLDMVPDNATPSDLYVGGDLTIEDSGVLDVWGWNGSDNSTSATLYFNGSNDAVFFIGDITSYTNALLEYESPNISDGGPDGNFPSSGTGEMHPWKYNLPLYNLIVDKPGGKLSLAANSPGKGGDWGNAAGQAGNWVCSNGGKNTRRWLSQLMSIKNQFKLLNGTFSQIDPYSNVTIVENGGGTYGSVGDPVGYSVNFYTTDVEIRDTMYVYHQGSTPKEGIIEVRAPNPLTLQTTDDAFIGNMRFIDDHDNPVTLVSDVHFGRIEYFNGTIDIGTHNLKVDLFETYAVDHTLRMDNVSSGQPVFGVPNFIRMAGNASDGGLSLKVPKQPTWPLPNNDEFEYLLDAYSDKQGPYAFPDRLWFPIGTDASGSDKYTPAVCRLQDYGTTDGDEYISVRVVDEELQTTDLSGGDVLSYYWNVDFEGYADGEEPTVSWIFQYDDADLDVGGGDETQFVPGKVLDGGDYTRSDEGGIDAVKDGGVDGIEGNILGSDPANIIIFNGIGTSGATEPDDDIESISSTMFDTDATGPNINSNWQNAWPNIGFTLEKANYTAGESNRFVGSPEVYYSYRSGSDGTPNVSWTDEDGWSLDSHESYSNPNNKVPGVGDIAVLGTDSRNNWHRVQTIDGLDIAELKFDPDPSEYYTDGFDYLPRLDVQRSHTVNIGVVKTESGRGEILARVDPGETPETPTINGDLNAFSRNGDNIFIYNATGSGLGSGVVELPDNISEYPILQISCSAVANGGKSIGDIVHTAVNDIHCKNLVIRAAGTLRLNEGADGDITVEHDISIGDNLREGFLEFPAAMDDANNKRIISCNNLLLNPTQNTAEVNVLSGGADNINHQFNVGGNITLKNGGRLDLFTDNSGGANVTLNLKSDSLVDHTFVNEDAASHTPELYRLTLDKGVDTATSFTFENNFTLHGPTSGAGVPKAIDLQNGKLILNDPNINVDLTTGDDDFYIPGTAGLEVRQGQANASGGSGILLDGKLQVSGGTVDMSGGDNYIQYSASGSAEIDVSAGQLTVGSQIRRGLTSTEGILTYNQSGGTVIVGNDAAPENNRGVFEILNSGSAFSHTGGDLIIARAQDNPSRASFYFDPETATFGEDAKIQFGNGSTPTDDEMGIYSTNAIPNILVDGTNTPVLQQWTVPLRVRDSLEILSGATYDANGLDLTLKGDLVANGTFSPSQNTTYFSGSGDQKIVGNINFWNLTKDQSNTLSLDNADATVSNELRLQAGIFDDGGHTLHIKGDVWMDAIHNHSGSSDGMAFDGSELQVLQSNNGEAIFGKLTINNTTGGADSIAVSVPKGNDIRVRDTLNMERGVFDIDKNLLVLEENAAIIEGNAFSTHNMIQTNISFTDIGIKKYFPEITSDTSFTYPIGSGGKYTPVEFDITGMNAGGSIRVKAADEIHPTIINDDEPCDEIIDSLNVLKYHWLMEAEGVSNFSGDVRMHYADGDVQIDNTESSTSYDVSDYITARLLLNSTQWNKYDPASFKETSQQLQFSFSNADDEGISGDYTAGVEDQDGTCEGAIPDEVPAYVTVSDGNWTDKSIWETYPESGGSVPSGGPKGAVAIIEHEVTIPRDYIINYKTTIDSGDVVNGILKVNETYGHRLGIVDGVGTLQVERGDLPAGIYEDFFSASGGTLEYSGDKDYDVLGGISQLNNLKFSGIGERRRANLDVGLYGNLEIAGTDNSLQVINEHDKRLEVEGDVTFSEGSFDAGSGSDALVRLDGNSKQRITGNFEASNAFNYLELNNSSGVEMLDSVEVDETFSLSSGMVYLPDTALVTLNSTSSGALSGTSSSQYIQGPLRKMISGGEGYTFPIGDTSRYGELELINNSTSSPEYWQAQYYNNNPDVYGYDTSSRASGLEAVSGNEFWMIKGPGNQSHVKIRWDDESILPAETDDRSANLHIAEYLSGQWESVGDDVTDNSVNAGKVQTNSTVDLEEHVFTLATEESAPKPTAAFVTSDTSVCEGNSIELTVELTEGDSWTIEVDENGTTHTYNPSSSPFTFEVTSSANQTDDDGTYTLLSVEDENGTSGNIYGDPVEVTVSSPPVPTIDGPNTVCQNTTEIYSVTPVSDDYYYDWLVTGGTIVAGKGTEQIQVEWQDLGTGSVDVAVGVDSTLNCESTDYIEVDVYETPEPNVTAPAQVCYPMAVDLDAGDAPEGSATFSYSWTSDSGIGSFDDPTLKEPSYTPDSNPGQASISVTFDVTIENDNKTGCNASGSVTMDIYRRPETGNTYYVPNDFDQ